MARVEAERTAEMNRKMQELEAKHREEAQKVSSRGGGVMGACVCGLETGREQEERGGGAGSRAAEHAT